MAITRRSTAQALAGIALAALLLTGCSIGTPESPRSSSTSTPDSGSESDASGQTTEEACEVLKAGVADTMAQLQSSFADAASDPAAASAAVDQLAAAFETTAADITNNEVAAVADEATTALNDFSGQIKTFDPSTADDAAKAAAQESATAAQASLTKLGTTCP